MQLQQCGFPLQGTGRSLQHDGCCVSIRLVEKGKKNVLISSIIFSLQTRTKAHTKILIMNGAELLDYD
jgi:hypothetical protein